MLNNQEIEVILTFLQRVDLKGNEAATLVMLQQKLAGMMTKEEPKVEETPEGVEKKDKKDK